VSEAPEVFLDNFEDGGSGVLDPLDGVRTLKQTIHGYKRERACVLLSNQLSKPLKNTSRYFSFRQTLSKEEKRKEKKKF